MTDGPDNSDLDPRDLDAWQVPEPPADFAARVIAARGRSISVQPVTAAAPRRWALAAVVVAAAVVAVLVAGGRGGQVATSGSWQAGARETVALGARGVAVAEAGAALHWNIDSRGAADVEQTAGDVFYRVERGGKFAVATPAGVVTVIGTCFRVAIRDPEKETEMKPNKQLVIGAALGAIVVVTVYEGRVLFADKRGGDTETVEAGESVTAGGGPRRVARGEHERADVTAANAADLPAAPSADVTRDQLLERDEVQRTEIAQLREKVRAFESGAIAVRKERGKGRRSFDPSHEELLEWVKDCKVQFDLPPIRGTEPTELPPGAAKELGLTPQEVSAVNKTYASVFAAYSKQVRALYIEVTGDSAGAESLSVESMGAEIREKSPPGDEDTLMKRLAEERAGLRPPPDDPSKLSPIERHYRLLGALGDDTERMLAAEIGADRAREIRELNDGWGSRMQVAGCPDDEEAPDVEKFMGEVKPEN